MGCVDVSEYIERIEKLIRPQPSMIRGSWAIEREIHRLKQALDRGSLVINFVPSNLFHRLKVCGVRGSDSCGIEILFETDSPHAFITHRAKTPAISPQLPTTTMSL